MSWLILDPDFFNRYKEATVNDPKATWWDLAPKYPAKDSLPKADPDPLTTALKSAGWTPPPTPADLETRKNAVKHIAALLGVRVEVK